MFRLAAPAFALFLIAASPGTATVEVDISGLRNMRGQIHVCITQNPAYFPDCRKDPRAIRQSAPATTRELRFTGVAPGRYAVTLFHDENTNHRLDTAVGIPREGFGFSRNPKIRFGAPKFDAVSIELAPAFTRTAVHMQYLL
ncbi:DUF2141 domain-containing protein [Sphingomonas lutea]|uniref:DUF2141 domain-containing protein n=1 Tax=Sphingomonas lutea TaxID=1045317 RepID=A0A7G9SEZ0_9SPHN|nr:DUF2141 domain-containing protein [Sphingomonas lutea]QNN66415.1 DUF2141 domain-containing protein [Sphingomonas lutea]